MSHIILQFVILVVCPAVYKNIIYLPCLQLQYKGLEWLAEK